MIRTLLVAAIVATMALPVFAPDAVARASTDYSILVESIDSIGSDAQSANYICHSGVVGQFYAVVALTITAFSNNLNETANTQVSAAPLLDDGTNLDALDPTSVSWSIVGGPIASISSSGLATAGNVYQDTLATVGGNAQSLSGQLSLTILNVTNDDFGAYANDQIDDSWQVQYFGQPPNPLAGPNADADGTGQTNLFKFVAGLNPLDGSRFILTIQPVIGQPLQKNLIFNPLVGGRTYTVQFTITLPNANSWSALTGTNQSDNGNQRTVTDLNATGAVKYYRVQISKP